MDFSCIFGVGKTLSMGKKPTMPACLPVEALVCNLVLKSHNYWPRSARVFFSSARVNNCENLSTERRDSHSLFTSVNFLSISLFLPQCIYICVCVCVYVYIFTYMLQLWYIYIYIYTALHICIHLYAYVGIYIYIYIDACNIHMVLQWACNHVQKCHIWPNTLRNVPHRYMRYTHTYEQELYETWV